jgi:hypothetical protein
MLRRTIETIAFAVVAAFLLSIISIGMEGHIDWAPVIVMTVAGSSFYWLTFNPIYNTRKWRNE